MRTYDVRKVPSEIVVRYVVFVQRSGVKRNENVASIRLSTRAIQKGRERSKKISIYPLFRVGFVLTFATSTLADSARRVFARVIFLSDSSRFVKAARRQ